MNVRTATCKEFAIQNGAKTIVFVGTLKSQRQHQKTWPNKLALTMPACEPAMQQKDQYS